MAQRERDGSGPTPVAGNYVLTTDGSGGGTVAAPNPAAIGVVLRSPRGTVAATISKVIAPATNTEAEYRALIEGLELARSRGISRLRIFSDSELVVDQMQQRAAVKAAHLVGCHEEAEKLLASFSDVRLSWVPRRWNEEADLLAVAALRDTENAQPTGPAGRQAEEDLPHIDSEGQMFWIAEHTDLPLDVVRQVLELEFEFLVAAGIVHAHDYELRYYTSDELHDVGNVVDTQRLAEDADRLLGVPVDVATQVLDAEYQFLRMRGLAN